MNSLFVDISRSSKYENKKESRCGLAAAPPVDKQYLSRKSRSLMLEEELGLQREDANVWAK